MALVAGQAALCAVIGWMTFGPSETKPQAVRAADPPGEPVVLPTASTWMPPLHVPPAPTSAGKSAAAPAPRVSRSARPAKVRRTSAPTREKPRTVMAPEESKQIPSEPAAPNPELASPVPPVPPSAGAVQRPVVVGERCQPEGAPGRTADDVELKCVRDRDGALVWQII